MVAECVLTKSCADMDGEGILAAGIVQNTSLVPAVKLTKASLFEEDRTVCLDKVSGVASVTVPIPTSNSAGDATIC